MSEAISIEEIPSEIPAAPRLRLQSRHFGRQEARRSTYDPKRVSGRQAGICRAACVFLSKRTMMPYSVTLNGDAGVSGEDLIVGVGVHGIRQNTGRPFSRLGVYAVDPVGILRLVRTVDFQITTGDPDFQNRPNSGGDIDRALANWISGALHNPDLGQGDYYPRFDLVNSGGFLGELKDNQPYKDLVQGRGVKPRDFALDRRLEARIIMVGDFMEKSEHSRMDQDSFNGIMGTSMFIESQVSENLLTTPGIMQSVLLSPEAFRECLFGRFKLSLPSARESGKLWGMKGDVQRAYLQASEQIDEMWALSVSAQMFEMNISGIIDSLQEQVRGYLDLHYKTFGGETKLDAKEYSMPYAKHCMMATHALRALYEGRANDGITVWIIAAQPGTVDDPAICNELNILVEHTLFTMVAPAGAGSIQVRTRFLSNGDFPYEGNKIVPIIW